jgi:hypothetical protein
MVVFSHVLSFLVLTKRRARLKSVTSPRRRCVAPGKSMTGGELVVVPPANSPISSEEAVIMGNTCLYGATGGRLLADGKAGERFAVRNSRAETVVLGAGDHCCEYVAPFTHPPSPCPRSELYTRRWT